MWEEGGGQTWLTWVIYLKREGVYIWWIGLRVECLGEGVGKWYEWTGLVFLGGSNIKGPFGLTKISQGPNCNF